MEAIKSWMADVFSHENEALTKALQISLFDNSPASDILSSLPPPHPPAAESKSFRLASSRSGIGRTSNPFTCIPSGKIAKKKTHSSKRLPTTYINADPADFQRMVQEVTGIQFGEVRVPVEKSLFPKPDRTGMSRAGQLKGLSFDRTTVDVCDTVGPVLVGPVSEPFPCFPTLESWGI